MDIKTNQVRIAHALELATNKTQGAMAAVEKALKRVKDPYETMRAEFLIKPNGTLIPFKNVEEQLVTETAAMYIIPDEKHPESFRAYSESVISLATGKMLCGMPTETDFFTRTPAVITLKPGAWVFARAESVILRVPNLEKQKITRILDEKQKQNQALGKIIQEIQKKTSTDLEEQKLKIEETISELDEEFKKIKKNNKFPKFLVDKNDVYARYDQWIQYSNSKTEYILVRVQDISSVNFSWWDLGNFETLRSVYDNAHYEMHANPDKPVADGADYEPPDEMQAPLHHLPWGESPVTDVIRRWMLKSRRGYVACGEEYYKRRIGAVAEHIRKNGTGMTMTAQVYTPTWPPRFLIEIKRPRETGWDKPLPSLLTRVSGDVYELPMWPVSPWKYNFYSEPMTQALDVLRQLADDKMCANFVDFKGGQLPEDARQKLENIDNSNGMDGSTIFYI